MVCEPWSHSTWQYEMTVIAGLARCDGKKWLWTLDVAWPYGMKWLLLDLFQFVNDSNSHKILKRIAMIVFITELVQKGHLHSHESSCLYLIIDRATCTSSATKHWVDWRRLVNIVHTLRDDGRSPIEYQWSSAAPTNRREPLRRRCHLQRRHATWACFMPGYFAHCRGLQQRWPVRCCLWQVLRGKKKLRYQRRLV